MDDNFNHIDKFYKDSLENYVPANRQKFGWGKLGLKLLIFNFGAWSLFAASLIFVGITSAVVYNFEEIEEFFITTSTIENSDNIIIVKPEKVKPFDTNGTNAIDNLDEGFTETFETIEEKEISGESIIYIKQEDQLSSFAKSEQQSSESIYFGRRSNPEITNLSEQMNIFSLSRINQKQIEFKQKQNLQKIFTQNTFSDSLENIGMKTRKVSLELFINPSFIFGKSSGSDEDYISNRNKNEDPILTLGFGGDVKFHFNKWFVQTGLNFSQYGEKANYQMNKQVYDPHGLVESIDTTLHYYYDPPFIGEPYIVSIDTNWIPGLKTVYYDQEVTNRISYIEIPVLGGYKWDLDKVHIDIATGLSFGIAISETGGFPSSTNSEFIQLGNVSLSEPLINYIFQAGVAVPIRERVKLLVKPNFKYTLNSIYNDDKYPASQKYLNIGLKVGVVIDL